MCHKWDEGSVDCLECELGLVLSSVGEGGITLTSALVSTRKRIPEAKSLMKRRQLKGRLGLLITASWPARFLTWSKVVDTCGLYHQTKSDTSRGWEVGGRWRCRTGWRNRMTDD